MKNISEYTFKTELHAHTSPSSACAEIPAGEVIEKFSKLGYSTVVITNHFNSFMPGFGDREKAVGLYLEDYYTAKKAGDKLGVNVILGCEMRFTENANEYLLYGIDEEFLYDAYEYLDKGINEFSAFYRKKGRLLIQAHPFRDFNNLADISLLDGIETFNVHIHHNSRIASAAEVVAENPQLIATIGTDFHHEGQQGSGAFITSRELKNKENLVEALESRDYLFRLSGHIVFPYGE